MSRTTRLVEVRRHVLKQNDVAARALRERFRAAGVYAVGLMSSPGAGKTALLERTLTALGRDHRVAALVGDLATDSDARRLARSGAPVRQITTGTVCHLEADVVARALGDWRLCDLDLLFVENVGNLVCPAAFDLGEAVRAVLVSVTEGEDKPLKYPTVFDTADVAVVTKLDLAAAAEFDAAVLHRNVQAVRPGMGVFEVSAKTGEGMGRWLDFLRSGLAAWRADADRPIYPTGADTGPAADSASLPGSPGTSTVSSPGTSSP
jgi:hydrogenase nickel incorporation protein HypB